MLNISDPNWQDQVVEGECSFLQCTSGMLPLSGTDHAESQPLSVALQALDYNRRSFNLIPAEWRKSRRRSKAVPTLIL